MPVISDVVAAEIADAPELVQTLYAESVFLELTFGTFSPIMAHMNLLGRPLQFDPDKVIANTAKETVALILKALD